MTSILVVDDDEAIRRSLAKGLERAGFEVETAGNGLEAARFVELRHWDAVVCDVVMPVMDGWRFYDWLREMHPEVLKRLVFVTAWRHEAWVRRFLELSGCPMLEKPFDFAELVDVVRQFGPSPT